MKKLKINFEYEDDEQSIVTAPQSKSKWLFGAWFLNGFTIYFKCV